MATKLSTLLNEAPALRSLAEQLARLEELHHVYSDAVPRSLSGASRVGYLDGSALIIIAFSGAAAASLRQRLPSLLARIQARQPQITAVRVEVQVEEFYTTLTTRSKPKPAERRLSAHGAQSLRNLAGSLPESPLRQAVDRLAGRVKKSDQDKPLNQVKERYCSEKYDKKPE